MGKPVRSRFGKVVSKIQIGDLVNFVPESRLPFAQISSIYQKNGRESIKLISKVALKKFSAGTTPKVVFLLLSNQIFRKLFVNGKHRE